MTTTANNRPWSPSNRDRLIYQWVKFEGRSQGWVAGELSLNQSTVSRIIDRYERWIAHGGPSQNGGLNREERLRAQHYLTIERNEWILASCMRLAATMEHLSDTSKSTTTHHCSDPSRELEVRTQHSVLDRTGKVCRYLRLAHRVNMDQKKLVAQEDLPDLEPLTLDPNEYSQAAADARDGFQLDTPFEKVVPSRREGQEAESVLNSAASQITSAAPETLARRASEGKPLSIPEASPAASQPPTPSPAPPIYGSDEINNPQFAAWKASLSAPCPQPPAPEPAIMHPVHSPTTQQQPLTSDTPNTSAKTDASQNSHSPAYAVASQPPEPTDPLAEILNFPRPNSPPPILLSLPFHIPLTS